MNGIIEFTENSLRFMGGPNIRVYMNINNIYIAYKKLLNENWVKNTSWIVSMQVKEQVETKYELDSFHGGDTVIIFM